MENIASNVELLYKKAEQYSKTSLELLKLHTIEKTSDVISSLTVVISISIIVGMFTLFVNIGISFFIGNILGNNASCVIDAMMTKVISDDMLTIGAWYDNEYGYSCRLIENAIFICK